MKLETIDIMVCPDCKSNFEIKNIFKRNEERIIAGIIGCKCWSYPILDEILIFDKKQIMNTHYLMELLRMGKIDTAISSPLDVKKLDRLLLYFYHFLKSAGSFKKLSPIIDAFTISLKKRRYNEYFGKNMTFFNLMNQLKPNTWGYYLKHRFSAESFWSIYPFIPILRENSDMILDLGCGAGHVAYVLSKNVSPKKLICIDRDYTLLQIAKRFFASDAEFICQDLNNPLPFKDGVFSLIIMLDSYHYVANRARLANDIERMLRSNSVLLISHLHNSLVETIARGFVLEPLGWESLFSKLKIKSIPEKELIVGLINENKLDLKKEYPIAELNKSRAITIIGTNDLELFKVYNNVHKPLLDGSKNLIINPIYNIRAKNGKIVLERKVSDERFRTEFPLSMKHFPKFIDLDKSFTNILEGRKLKLPSKMPKNEQNGIEDMIRNFIILEVPKRYI